MFFDLMKDALPAHATDHSKYKTNCPFCGKNLHFYFNLRTKTGICFVCMDKPIKLGPEFIIEPDSKPTKNLDELRAALSKIFTTNPKINDNGIDIDVFSEPITPTRHPLSYGYITKERRLTDDDIKKYDIRSGKPYREGERVVNKWLGRVIFPFYDRGKCVYAIGRTYTGDDRKYRNVDVPKTDIVYGINRIQNRECIICEGLFSAIAAEKTTGVSAICLLGKTISPLQVYKIKTNADRVWLSLDGGVPETQVKSVIRSLIKSGFREVLRINLPGDLDPDELEDDYTEYFDKAIKVSYL